MRGRRHASVVGALPVCTRFTALSYSTSKQGALSHIKVLDMSRILAGKITRLCLCAYDTDGRAVGNAVISRYGCTGHQSGKTERRRRYPHMGTSFHKG